MKIVLAALWLVVAVSFTALISVPVEAGNNGAKRYGGGYAKKHQSYRKNMRKRRAVRHNMRRQGGYRKSRRVARHQAGQRYGQNRRGKYYKSKRRSRGVNPHQGRNFDRRRFKGRRARNNNRISIAVASFASASAFSYSAPRFKDYDYGRRGYGRKGVVYDYDNRYVAYQQPQAVPNNYGYYAPAYVDRRAYAAQGAYYSGGYYTQPRQPQAVQSGGYWHYHPGEIYRNSRGVKQRSYGKAHLHKARYQRRQAKAQPHKARYQRPQAKAHPHKARYQPQKARYQRRQARPHPHKARYQRRQGYDHPHPAGYQRRDAQPCRCK